MGRSRSETSFAESRPENNQPLSAARRLSDQPALAATGDEVGASASRRHGSRWPLSTRKAPEEAPDLFRGFDVSVSGTGLQLPLPLGIACSRQRRSTVAAAFYSVADDLDTVRARGPVHYCHRVRLSEFLWETGLT